MTRITEIVSVIRYLDKKQSPYYRTIALTDHPVADEVVGYGRAFRVGDVVQVFFDDKYHVAKMRKNKVL